MQFLFTLRNNFYLGAYQAAIAEAADLERLAEADTVERDCFVYRSYIELGSFEVGYGAESLCYAGIVLLNLQPTAVFSCYCSLR